MRSTRGGEHLRDWLRENGHTQETFGELMGTHQTNISAWIRGRIPALGFALTIERLTGIPAKEWTEDAEAPRPSRPPPRKQRAA